MFRQLLAVIGCLLLALSMNAEAHVSVILSVSPPPPREVVVPPPGYMGCHTVPGGYYNGIWINQHSECQYYNSPGMWVAAHWECMHMDTMNGICRSWSWVPSYWTGPEPVVYGPPVVYSPPVVYAPPAAVVYYGPHYYHHHHDHWR